jgi:hypothetical protein
LFLHIGILALSIWNLIIRIGAKSPLGIILACVILAVVVLGFAGFFIVNPNESKVLQLFGKYAGSVRITGLRRSNPFYTKKRVSLRVRNFETSKLKVNDKSGNAIEIAAALQVWADDELRNLNGQIEFLLRQALKEAGRLPRRSPKDTKR